jgi:pantoate kinase
VAQTPEAKVKAAIKKIFEFYDVYYVMPMGTGYGNSGPLDFSACVRGRYIGVEAKAGNGKTTALQDRHIEQIRAAGGIALVINELNLNELGRTLYELTAKS